MYYVIFDKTTGRVTGKGTFDPSYLQGNPDVGILPFLEDEGGLTWAKIPLEHLVVDNPSTTPALREMTQAEKDAFSKAEQLARDAIEQSKRDSEVALVEALVEAEIMARSRGTQEAIARANRIKAEIAKRMAGK